MRCSAIDRELHTLNIRQLAPALPHLRPMTRDDRDSVVAAFQAWLAHASEDYRTWQQAWNAWSGATPEQNGRITFLRNRCPDCAGRRYALRHGMIGVCTTCVTGRWRTVSTLALWQCDPYAPQPDPPREKLPEVGDRVVMTGSMPNDPDPLDVGAAGTVTGVGADTGSGRQIMVDWDNGRTLILLSTDPFTIAATT